MSLVWNRLCTEGKAVFSLKQVRIGIPMQYEGVIVNEAVSGVGRACPTQSLYGVGTPSAPNTVGDPSGTWVRGWW